MDDNTAAALDHIRTAKATVSDAIDAAEAMYVDDLGPTGQAFKSFAMQLAKAERDRSRAEGELNI